MFATLIKNALSKLRRTGPAPAPRQTAQPLGATQRAESPITVIVGSVLGVLRRAPKRPAVRQDAPENDAVRGLDDALEARGY